MQSNKSKNEVHSVKLDWTSQKYQHYAEQHATNRSWRPISFKGD